MEEALDLSFDRLLMMMMMSRKFKFLYNLTRITGTLHEDLSLFVVISRLIHFRMRNVSDKSCRENQNIFYVQKRLFRKSCRFLRKVMRKNMVRVPTGHR